MHALPMVLCLLFTVASVLLDDQGKSWHTFPTEGLAYNIFIALDLLENTKKLYLYPC